jgi:hypothetical protein
MTEVGQFYRRNKAIRQLRQGPANQARGVTIKLWIVMSVTGGMTHLAALEVKSREICLIRNTNSQKLSRH